MKTPLRALACLTLAVGLVLPASRIAAREPMKLEEGSPLDLRVLTRPGAVLRDGPAATPVKKPPVFSAYYVFARENRDGTEWLEVGADHDGARTGWVRADETVTWEQTVVLGFTNPADRIPVLFFEDRPALEGFVNEAMSTRAELLAEAIRNGQTTVGSGVIASEPPAMVPITEQFYLLPILDFARIKVNNRQRKIVEVASINQEATPAEPAEQRPFRVGVVFVVDTSTSMGPYIERTKKAIADILRTLTTEDTRDRVSFGMVGFRSSTALTPALEYTAREFYPLERDFDEAAFFRALESMTASTVSSHAFDEDGLSGLKLATEMPGWQDFDGRYIVYITDAGMLVGADQGSSAGTRPEFLATRAQKDLGIATFALFLETKAGRAYHRDALDQLAKFTKLDSAPAPFVYPIENGSVDAFGTQVDRLAASLLDQVRQSEADRPAPPTVCETNPDDIVCGASAAGNAMRLAWLGRQEAAQAPATYRAWAATFALDDPGREALEPRILLTRGQLNDLYVTLEAMTETFDQPDADPGKFFSALKTTLARMMRDPGQMQALDPTSRANVPQVEEFDDLGDLLGPYFANLPYESDLAQVTQEDWIDMQDSGRREQMEAIKAKMSMYELYYADADNWVTINPDGGESEKVYPVPLAMMP